MSTTSEPREEMPAAPPTRGEKAWSVAEVADAFGVPEMAITEVPPATSAADILDGMAATFRERQKVYGSNYKMVAPLVRTLFPNGVPSELVASDKWHLFELILVKLSRLAISNLTHMDSIHDMGVYCAMVEHCMKEEKR